MTDWITISQLWDAYNGFFVVAALCNLLSDFLSNYGFTGGLLLLFLGGGFLTVSILLEPRDVEQLLAKPMNNIAAVEHFDLYAKELCSLLLAKSTCLIL
jgi:hypothetical protein